MGFVAWIASSSGRCTGVFDQDVAQVESFAGLDREVFMDAAGVIGAVRRVIGDTVGCTGDQGGEIDSALSVGDRRLCVIDRVDLKSQSVCP